MEQAGTEAVLDLSVDAHSPGAARRFVAATLRAWGLEHLVDTTTLLVSELVTNSVLHARTPVSVRCAREGRDAVLVTVEDGSAVAPRVRRFGPDAATGRGLALVERLAGAWGSSPTEGGKAVWFRLRGTEAEAAWGSFDLDAAEAI